MPSAAHPATGLPVLSMVHEQNRPVETNPQTYLYNLAETGRGRVSGFWERARSILEGDDGQAFLLLPSRNIFYPRQGPASVYACITRPMSMHHASCIG